MKASLTQRLVWQVKCDRLIEFGTTRQNLAVTSTVMMTMTELIRRKIEKHRRHEAGKRNLAN